MPVLLFINLFSFSVFTKEIYFFVVRIVQLNNVKNVDYFMEIVYNNRKRKN